MIPAELKTASRRWPFGPSGGTMRFSGPTCEWDPQVLNYRYRTRRMGWIILAFIVYWLILFVGCYVVVDYSQKYLYDETTPSFGLKLTGGTFLMALLMTILRKQTTYDTMFTSYIHWTVLQAIVWFGVFTLIFRFQPLHGLTLGLACFILMAGMASLAVDSLTGEVPPEARIELHPPPKPPRRPASPGPMPPPVGTQPAAEQPEAKDAPKS